MDVKDMPLVGTQDYVTSLIEINQVLLSNMIIVMDVKDEAKTIK